MNTVSVWEPVDPDTDRLKVPGGWLVRCSHLGAVGAAVSLVYVPDPNCSWHPEGSLKEKAYARYVDSLQYAPVPKVREEDPTRLVLDALERCFVEDPRGGPPCPVVAAKVDEKGNVVISFRPNRRIGEPRP